MVPFQVLIFYLCTTPLSKVISIQSGDQFHFMLIAHSDLFISEVKMKNRILDVKNWMFLGTLEMNPDKIKLILFGP